jgi:glucosamine-phosphate N-acetyltransferase
MTDIIIRELNENDYSNYIKLMFEFTGYNHNITEMNFKNKLSEIKQNYKIIILTVNNELVGCGTIIKIDKLHNNPIGQIEDVIVSNKYRSNGFGKKIIEKLITIGMDEFKCYKIILNCLDHNINFYKKCKFSVVGVEMKYNTPGI